MVSGVAGPWRDRRRPTLTRVTTTTMPSSAALTVQDLCTRLEAKAEQQHESTMCVVGLVGVPGAGKSTVAAAALAELTVRRGEGWAGTLPMDGFHLWRSQLDAMEDPVEAHARRGSPFTFDPAGFVACLAKIRAEGGGTAPGFDHTVGDPEPEAFEVQNGTKLLIVEGNYLLLGRLADEAFVEGSGRQLAPEWRQVTSAFDSVWYIDTPVDVAMERVTRRNMSNPGWEDLSLDEATLRVDANDRVNADLVARSGEYADFSFTLEQAGL